MTPPLLLPQGNAICYSGYRAGQRPGEQIYPSLAEIREDLAILQKHWQLLRLYDSSPHAERVLLGDPQLDPRTDILALYP